MGLERHTIIVMLFTSLVFFSSTFVNIAYAQTSEGVAVFVPITETDAQDGDIVSLSEKGFTLSSQDYDANMYGIVSESPAVAFENEQKKEGKPVLRAGRAYVRVSGQNGPIKKGDLVTSSKRAGIGQKATRSGIVVGLALESFEPANKDDVGKIFVALSIGYSAIGGRLNLLELIKTGAGAPFLTPLGSLRYLLAALVVIISLVLGFVSSGRIVKAGIEALGRNPLAGKLIEFTVFLNIALSLGIMFIGLAIGYIILVI